MGFSLRISVIPEFFTKNTHFHDQNYTLLFKIMFNENALFFIEKSNLTDFAFKILYNKIPTSPPKCEPK
jgi:hypothetical protein